MADMFASTEEFFGASQPCVAAFDAFAKKHALPAKAAADHICYKCGSRESFEAVRFLFERESMFIYQSIISGRPIAIIKFTEPIESALGPIWYLELSDQKPDGSQKEGFDHIEAYPLAGTYEDLVGSLRETETVVHVNRPHHATDDITLPGGFLFRCTKGKLIEKIKEEEM